MSTIKNEINLTTNPENSQKNDEYFLEINTKNNFEISYNKDYSYLNTLIIKKGIIAETDFGQDLDLIYEYLNSIFTDCYFEPFLTSLFISKNVINNQGKKLLKDFYKEMDIFIQNPKKTNINYNISIIKHFRLIGFTLCLIYDNLKKYNIDNMQKFIEAINNINKSKIYIYDEYINFVNTKENWKNDSPFKLFINKNKSKYKLPCELILLLNYFRNIYNLEMNYEKLILNEDDFPLLAITLINIDLLFKKVNNVQLNLINIPFLSDIFSRFFRLEKEVLNNTNKYLKYFNYTKERNFFVQKNLFDEIDSKEKNNFDNGIKNFEIIENNFIPDLMNIKIDINDIIEKYKYFLSSIIITFFCLQKFVIMNKLDLIINDIYDIEFKCLFRKNCFTNLSSTFNILNFLQMINDLVSLSIELNFIDFRTTNQLLEFIYRNKFITQLQISLFSSEAFYIHQAIYRLYSQNKDFIYKENKLNYIEEPETNFLNQMIVFFEKNLRLLFDIIVEKKILSKLILYINIPSILINNQAYMILILKFVINILFLLDDESSGLNILSLFCPNIALDKDLCPILEDYFDEFDIYKKNNTLIEFNLKVQIYKIININKLVSTNLIILNIGDFDLISFGIFINYIISYKFSYNSNLKKLTINLLNSIVNISQKIIELISKLYSVKIESLIELNFVSNLIIDSTKIYNEIMSNLKYHWISCTNMTFNEKSDTIIEKKEELRKSMNYLQHNFLEVDNINKFIGGNKCIELYWILKYIFINKFKLKRNDANKFIYGIFKYSNKESKMVISQNSKC